MDTFRYKRAYIRSFKDFLSKAGNSIVQRRTLRPSLRHRRQFSLRVPSTAYGHLLVSIRVTGLIQHVRTNVNAAHSNRTRQLIVVTFQCAGGNVRRSFSFSLRNARIELFHPSMRVNTIVYRISAWSRNGRRGGEHVAACSGTWRGN